MWLIVVDARTKWPEVFQLNEATSGTTITALMTTFSRFGLPEIIVTDNGSQFTSDQFKTFCDENGIRHVRVAPYHPSSNGEAERFVKTFKRAFSAMGNEKDPVRRLQQFLFSYRNTPHSTTGVSPAELLVGRQLRGRLDLLRQQTCITNTSHCPNPEVKVQACQRRQKIAYDKHAKQREFTVGQAVWVKGQNHQQNWLPGVIVKQRNSVSYTVNVSGQLWHRHVDHLRGKENRMKPMCKGQKILNTFLTGNRVQQTTTDIITDENAPNLRHEQQPIHDATPQEDQATLPEHATVEKRRKSTREHRPPVRFHEEFGYNDRAGMKKALQLLLRNTSALEQKWLIRIILKLVHDATPTAGQGYTMSWSCRASRQCLQQSGELTSMIAVSTSMSPSSPTSLSSDLRSESVPPWTSPVAVLRTTEC
eukprot:Em0140g3a